MPKLPNQHKEFEDGDDDSETEEEVAGAAQEPNPLSRTMARRKRGKRMRTRDVRKFMLIYPEDEWKGNWDLFVTVILIFTCLSTPYLISFDGADTLEWIIINFAIDMFFLVDIIFNFNQAFYDEDFVI